MSEILLAFLVIGVLYVADADRLQELMDHLRELMVWLAE